MRTCKTCGHTDSRVTDSRLTHAGTPFESMWRRRKCVNCESQWTTREIPGAVYDHIAGLWKTFEELK